WARLMSNSSISCTARTLEATMANVAVAMVAAVTAPRPNLEKDRIEADGTCLKLPYRNTDPGASSVDRRSIPGRPAEHEPQGVDSDQRQDRPDPPGVGEEQPRHEQRG